MSHVNLIGSIVSNPKLLWYITRATGIIALLLLGAIVILGIMTATKSTPAGIGKFIGPDLHRRLSLTTVIFLGVHIVTAILDPFVKIGITTTIIPFVSKYRPLWVGLGTLSFDLMLIIIATSIVRHKFPHSRWKKIHYLSWAVVGLVLFHALGTGSDDKIKIVEIIYVAFVLGVGAFGIFRTSRERGLTPIRKLVAGASLSLVPLAILAWASQGPLKPGWAKSSSSFSILPKSTSLSATTVATTGVISSSSPTTTPSVALPVNGSISGTVVQSQTSAGVVILTLRGSVANSQDYVEVQLNGVPQNGALVLQSSTAYFGTVAKPNTYVGTVSQANGSSLVLSLSGPSGKVLASMNVSLSGSTFSGTFSAPFQFSGSSEGH